jgi:hypothetical protein
LGYVQDLLPVPVFLFVHLFLLQLALKHDFVQDLREEAPVFLASLVLGRRLGLKRGLLEGRFVLFVVLGFEVVAERQQPPLHLAEADIILPDDGRVETVKIEQDDEILVEPLFRLQD